MYLPSRPLFPLLLLTGVCDGLSYYFGNGSHYEGEVDHYGRPSGSGQFYTNKGVLTYNGTFRAGQFNGNGVWYGNNGHKYQGDFLDGAASGTGSWETPSGDIIQGHFRNHTIHGDAVWIFSTQVPRLEKMAGVFRRGLAHGDGTVFFRNGNRLVGKFKKGYPHGAGVLSGADDAVLWEGIIWNGTPMGIVPPEIAELFQDFYTNPLRLKYKDARYNKQ